MSGEESVQVNFGKPMPLFPLPTAVLLPQQAIPLTIFEPRYRQLVTRVLDGSGQFALASFAGERWRQEYHGRSPLRPAVCVAQIVKHHAVPDGTYVIVVQGITRARIVRESEASVERLYREALLAPVGLENDEDDEELREVRELLEELLEEGPLTRLAAAKPVLEFVRDDDVPLPALLEVVSFSLLGNSGLTYRLLAEGNLGARARLILGELSHLETMIKKAASQKPNDAPKGVTLN